MLQSTQNMPWEPSPSPTVERKRLELVGPKEAGRVTSVVRYLPNSDFKPHPHPDGEEILVLDGVFSDDSGDYPTGTYILNPEGFEHGPRSKDGCTLLVKLKQYPGLQRRQIRVYSSDPKTWQPAAPDAANGVVGVNGEVKQCQLYRDLPGETYGETMDLYTLASPTSSITFAAQPRGLEVFVMDASQDGLKLQDKVLRSGDWFKLTSTSEPTEVCGTAMFYVKTNHL